MMKSLVPSVGSVVLLVACGLVHGYWTERWRPEPDPESVSTRFATLPLTVGEWRGEDLPVGPRELRGFTGHLLRRYVHATKGESVMVTLVSGSPRVVSLHTPDSCYAASGFVVSTPTKHTGANLPEVAEFWTADMTRSRIAEQTKLRVYYAWSNGGRWQAADNARVTFAGARNLYKLYLIRDLGTTSTITPSATDPCLELMADLQTELAKCL